LARGSGFATVRRGAPMTRSRAAFVAPVLAALVTLGACGGGSATDAAGSSSPDRPRPQATAPDGTIGDITFERFDGSPARFAVYGDTPLVINFFAYWCAHCVRELPVVEAVHQALGNHVSFLVTSVSERAEDGRRIAEATGVSLDLVRDPRGESLRAAGGAAMT